jgi:hypothetical protein
MSWPAITLARTRQTVGDGNDGLTVLAIARARKRIHPIVRCRSGQQREREQKNFFRRHP